MSRDKQREASRRFQDRIKEKLEQAQADKRREMFRRRVEVARIGIRSFQAKEISEAVRHFEGYLEILEDWKECPRRGLTPGHFDIQKDQSELLLISGVYWDLVKLYDRTRSPEKYQEFKHFLKQFVLFTRGMPFQSMCAESMRKYISYGGAVHKEDLRNAYDQVATSKCFIATELKAEIHPLTLMRLRFFRDEVLLQSTLGAKFVHYYYLKGPRLVEIFKQKSPLVRRATAKILDGLAYLFEQITHSRGAKEK